MNGIFVIGPAKSATTLMIALLDNHPNLSVMPLEIKFYEHFTNSLSSGSNYEDINRFFFEESKIKHMNPIYYASVDKMNSGRTDFKNVDFDLFRSLMDRNVQNYKENSNGFLGDIRANYLVDLNKAYVASLGRDEKDINSFAVKEGNHGLPYIDMIINDFPKAKFIVMVRDPRDMYASFKITQEAVRSGGSFPSFYSPELSLLPWLLGNVEKSCAAYMRYFADASNSDRFHFVRYEDVVGNTQDVMHGVSDFVDVAFNASLLDPTTAGRLWGGNSSNEKKFTDISSSRVQKWKKILDKREVLILEYYLKGYMDKYGYVSENNKISPWNVLASFRLKDIDPPNISYKDFFRPYVRIAKYVYRILFYVILTTKKVFIQ